MKSLRNGRQMTEPRSSKPRLVAKLATLSRKAAPVFVMALVLGTAGLEEAAATSPEETVSALSDHFAAVPTMTGGNSQFNPDGQQTGGTFYLERPGRIRFNYESRTRSR
ncbi:MAG: outer-membrane lipoprotein carrier protein LolA [Nitratireductor sp.]